ncbi:MAG: hypothetical protein FJ038_12495 [Chloroflexi bacterium]|nr:hypothetical protein [Chloroflexota bacterium]
MLISFWSPKGGTTCTTTAFVTAVRLSKQASVTLTSTDPYMIPDLCAIAGMGANLTDDASPVEVAPNLWIATPDTWPVPEHEHTILDLGTYATAHDDAALVMVTTASYLALRRAVHHPLTLRSRGFVLFDEPGHSINGMEAADVLSIPKLVRSPHRAAVARAVDAGILGVRLPTYSTRLAATILTKLGMEVAPDPLVTED